MQFDETQKAWILSHLCATPAEKVAILRRNTYRFYINEYGMWVMRGTPRLRILDELEAEALERENYELCAAIVEARNHLLTLPEYNRPPAS